MPTLRGRGCSAASEGVGASAAVVQLGFEAVIEGVDAVGAGEGAVDPIAEGVAEHACLQDVAREFVSVDAQ